MVAGKAEPRGIGDELKAVRINAGKALKDIAAELRIRADHLQAIENGDLDRLPGPAYVSGFIRSYAAYLGFDGSEIVAHFRDETQTRALNPPLVFPEPVYEGRMPASSIVLVSALAAIILFVAWIALSRDGTDARLSAAKVPDRFASLIEDKAEAPSPSPSILAVPNSRNENAPPDRGEPIATVPATVEAIEIEVVEAPVAAYRDTRSRVTILANSDVWISIRDTDEEPFFEGILHQGETIQVPDGDSLKISTGNAGGLEIAVDGAPVDAMGPAGAVVRGVSLDPDELLVAKQSR